MRELNSNEIDSVSGSSSGKAVALSVVANAIYDGISYYVNNYNSFGYAGNSYLSGSGYLNRYNSGVLY
jgi:hypothetical protein